ncbi:hypothetical protein [Cypionkella aquatica]|nr:hypothetical protein [Cypionkella aquatica]
MLPHARQIFSLLTRLGLCFALPLMLALLPYQQTSLNTAAGSAISAQAPAVLLAPLKTSIIKPTPPETRARSLILMDNAAPPLPQRPSVFRLLRAQQPLPQHSTQVLIGWQARAPPASTSAPSS